MNIVQTIKNGEFVPLYTPHSLYLTKIAKLNISVSLPISVTGKTISNWEIMEKMRSMIQPEQFSVLKVSTTTLDFLRFESEIENYDKMDMVLSRLNGRSFKLQNFSENCKIRASQAKDDFPTRHDWDTFFRDAKDMDEMKTGERPDTIHLSNMPIRWFCPRHQENDDNVKPSEHIFKRIFEKYGNVRSVDIPICDPYRKEMKSHITGMKTFSFDQELYFEGYVQFSEYSGFSETMRSLRGMKLVRKEGDKCFAVNIQVDFDRSKHLSDASIKRRNTLRDRFIERDKKRQQDEEEKKIRERQKQEEQRELELQKQRERENKRKEKHLKKIREKEQNEISQKIHSEEKKLLVAQRKLESIRLLGALFDRLKFNAPVAAKMKKINRNGTNGGVSNINHTKEDLRNKLFVSVKSNQENELERQKNRVHKMQQCVKNPNWALKGKDDLTLTTSLSSSEDDEDMTNVMHKIKIKKKKKKHKSDSGSSSSSGSEEETETTPMVQAQQQPPAPFPMYNPATGEWLSMGMGMGMYPYPGPFFPGSQMMMPGGYRGGRFPMRFPRARGRGRSSYRGGRGSSTYQSHYNKHDRQYEDGGGGGGYDDYKDYRESSKYSRSRSRSKGRRSRSRSKGRRSRSRSKSRKHSRSSRTRSRNRSSRRSRTKSKSKTKRLVSTLRKSNSSNRWSSSSSRSRSRSRTRRKRSWSSRSKDSHSRSRSRSYRRSGGRGRHSRSRSNSKHKVVLEKDELMKTAREIQRSVQAKLHDSHTNKETTSTVTDMFDDNISKNDVGGTPPPIKN